MNRLQFVFDLIDRMSGPANTIVSVLDRLLGITDRLGNATDRSSTRMGAAFTRLQSGMDTVKSRAESFGRTMEGIHGSIERVFSLPNIIGATVIGEVVKTVIESGIQKEMTMTNFKLMLGSDTKAKQAYGDMINFAGMTPIKTDVLQRAWSKLLTDGFSEKAVPMLLSGIGDLSAASGFSEDSMMNIVRIIAHTKNLGHLNGVLVRELSQSWNLSTSKLDEAIAARMHVKPSQVPKLISTGRVDSTDAIMAILDAVQKQYDNGQPLGTNMFKQSQTLGGLFSTLASRPMEFLGGIADTEGFDSLKKLTKNLGDAFNPSSPKGQKLQTVLLGVLGKITDLMAGPLVKLTSGDGLTNAAQKFADYVQKALDWWQKDGPAVVRGIHDFAGGFMDAFRTAQQFYNFIKPALTWVDETLAKITGSHLGSLAHLLGILAFGGLVLKGGGLLFDGGAFLVMTLNKLTLGIIPKLIGLLPGLGGALSGLAVPALFMADLALIATDIELFRGLKAQQAVNASSEAQDKAQIEALMKKGPLGYLIGSRLKILHSDDSGGVMAQERIGVLTAQEKAIRAGQMTAQQALTIDKAPGGVLTDSFMMTRAGTTFALGFNSGADTKKLGTDLATSFQTQLTSGPSALFGAGSTAATFAAFGASGSLPSSSGVVSGPNGTWAGYGASVYSEQIGMAADVLSKKLAAAGGDTWGASGGIRRYNGLGKNADGSWMNPDYISNVAAATRDQPWLAAIKKAAGPRLDELNYINAQTDTIAKQKGIDPRTLKGLMWWESEGWHADLPGDGGRGGGLGQVLGYHVPARGTGTGSVGHTVNLTQNIQMPPGTTRQDAAALAKVAQSAGHAGTLTALSRAAMQGGH